MEQQQELLPPAPAAPDDFEGRLEFFREHGYVFLPRAIEGDVRSLLDELGRAIQEADSFLATLEGQPAGQAR